jgi:hypothetical protein
MTARSNATLSASSRRQQPPPELRGPLGQPETGADWLTFCFVRVNADDGENATKPGQPRRQTRRDR